MHFIHPYSHKTCTIRRTQLPISPAFAMTAHKAQGQTVQQAIVDIQSCQSVESVYVMLSRVTTLEGLAILRPFDKQKIQNRMSEDRRKEGNK
jgi:ATP-dependent exoDNAse (exonuclease V) alpha subunit